jgi:hypothetical protein
MLIGLPIAAVRDRPDGVVRTHSTAWWSNRLLAAANYRSVVRNGCPNAAARHTARQTELYQPRSIMDDRPAVIGRQSATDGPKRTGFEQSIGGSLTGLSPIIESRTESFNKERNCV